MNPVPSQRRPAKTRPAPARDPVYAAVDLNELRRMRTGLAKEESKVSYWRRIIQARIDVISSSGSSAAPVDRLAELLADARTSHRRVAALSVEPLDDVAPLPDLAELWHQVAGDAPAERQELVDALSRAEADLSAYRRLLHDRIDQVTAELIARYRQNPSLALTALNERMHRH